MNYVSGKITPINRDLAKLFAEMEQSYVQLKRTPNATITMCKQNMVTMRECHENLLRWMQIQTGCSDEKIYKAAANQAPGKVDKRIDTYELILAFADLGYVSNALVRQMHRVRMLGNDAAHYSAIDNGKPNALRGKSPAQVMDLCNEMYETLISIASQVIDRASQLKSASAHKAQSKRKQKSSVPLFVWVLALIIICIIMGLFYEHSIRLNQRELQTNSSSL